MANPRLAVIAFGGASSSLDALSSLTSFSMLVAAAFKFAGTSTWANGLRSTYPGLQRILMYQAAADIPGGTSIEGGVSKAQCDTHDAAVGGGATGDYWLFRSSYPSGTLQGAYSAVAPPTSNYFGNIKSASFQAQWVANATARATAAGADGIFIDNCLSYLAGSAPVDPATGVAYTDATWATAMAAFLAAVVPQLQANAGLHVVSGNVFDGSNRPPGDVIWQNRVAVSLNGSLTEYWMQTAGGLTVARLDQAADAHYHSQWANIANVAQGLGKDFHADVTNAQADANVRTYSYGTFLLRWNGVADGKLWVNPVNSAVDDMAPWAATMVNPGAPAKAFEEVNADGTVAAGQATTDLYRRYFDGGIVFVNAHQSTTHNITSFGDSRTYKDNTGATVTPPFTLAPGNARILSAAVVYTPAAPTAGWKRIAVANSGPGVGAVTQTAAAIDRPVSKNDLVVVAVSRSHSGDDTATETVTDNLGNVYTQIASRDYDSSDIQSMVLYYCVVTKPGLPTIYGNFPNASTFGTLVAVAYRNLNRLPALEVSATYGGSPARQVLAGVGTDTVTLPLTTVLDGDLLVGAWGNASSAATFAAGTGHTMDMGLAGGGIVMESKVQAVHGAANVTMSPSGAMNAIGVAAAFSSTLIPTSRREPTPIQPGDWAAVSDYLASVTVSGVLREVLPIQPGDWGSLNQYLAMIPTGGATLRERLPLQPGNWDSLNQYLALL